jgi:multidrug resistance efflux pump
MHDLNHTRRSALATVAVGTVGVAALVGKALAQDKPPEPSKKYNLRAPDDVLIKKVLKHDGAVEKGDALFELRSIDADKFEERIALIKSLMGIAERDLSDERVSLHRKLLTVTAENAKTARDSAKAVLDKRELQYDFGATDQEGLQQAKVAYAQAETALSQAETDLTEFEFKNPDRKDRVTAMKLHLAKEEQFIIDFKQMLKIQSPAKGIFKLALLEGTFAKKGEILATLEI